MNGLLERYGKLQKENQKLKEELADLKENYVSVRKYWFEDEGGNKWFDTEEMESEFHDTLVDMGAYENECRCCECDCSLVGHGFNMNDGCRVCDECYKSESEDEEKCVKCDKQFGETESSFPNKDGDAVCADCLIDEK